MNTRASRENLSNRIAKEAGFILFTVLLVLGLALFISETAMSQSDGNISVDEQHFQALEQEYVQEIRVYLEEQGFQNSGVSLTRIVEADGSRSYQVLLHHKGLKKLTASEQEALLEAVEELAFRVAGCNFQINFLG